MKSLFRFTAAMMFWGLLQARADTSFTSLYVFGDGMCTTTNGLSSPLYYGQSFCNGRVWVEVLSQWQGLAYDSNKNWSFYGHDSVKLAANASNFVAPDIGTALVTAWACDADFVDFVTNLSPYDSSNLAAWTNGINQSLANYQAAIQVFYAKGARHLLLPNAVDLTKVPTYSWFAPASKSFIRQRTVDFNNRFSLLLSNAVATLPGLKLYAPDVFGLLDDVSANPAKYGFTNATTDCLNDGITGLNSLAAFRYAFWDDLDPTAKFQMVLADLFQQQIAPVQFGGANALGAAVQLNLSHVPVGRSVVLEESTNFVNWSTCQEFLGTNLNQSPVVTTSEPRCFYRARFPLVWTWP